MNVWIKTDEERLDALLADEAKTGPMLETMLVTIRQLKAKHTFRLALINQLIEDRINTHNQSTGVNK